MTEREVCLGCLKKAGERGVCGGGNKPVEDEGKI